MTWVSPYIVGKSKGGGILIYFSNHLNIKRRADFETSEVEYIWIEINIKHNKPIFVCLIYRPPSAAVQCRALFALQLDKVANLENEKFILGDFNINLLARNSTTNKLSQTMELYDLKQWNCMTLNNGTV